MTTKFASLLTLGMLGTMVFAILATSAFFFGAIDIPTLLFMTIAVNLLSWIFALFINDLIYRLLYKIKFYKQEEFRSLNPELSEYISVICQANKVKFPKIGIIDDDNPTAFTYGSLPSNARLVFSKGIFTYLNQDEVEAVIAHEVGHIVHYDFLVMTIANTLVQILYELYFICTKTKSKNSRDKNPLAFIGIVSYIFYIIATYVLLLLSRKREYYADEFSAQTTQRPNSLSSALIKIAYGMVTLNSDTKSRKLLESTRAMGIMDPHVAKGIGVVSQVSGQDSGQIGKVLAYDFVSPWATILEFGSTHPLTGKRIQRLDEMAENFGQEKSYDIRATINNMNIDKKKLYSGFYLGAFMYYLPIFGLLTGFFFGGISAALTFCGLGVIVKTLYKFNNDPVQNMTLLELMTDIYASPAKGRKVVLEGKIIGRGEAGAYLSEDLMFQDSTGLIYLDYTSKFGSLGNLFFALKKVFKIINQDVQAEGWFFRGNYQMISVSKIKTVSETIKSHPRLWSLLGGLALIVLSGAIG